MSNAPLRIAIVDDHALFREGLKSLLRSESDVAVVAEAGCVDDLIPILARISCDMVLLDLQTDPRSLSQIPDLVRQVRVIGLTASEFLGAAVEAFRAGLRAVVFKCSAVETLLEAIRTVGRGDVWLPPVLQARVVDGLRESAARPVTNRERDIIRCVALGLRNAEVAQRLQISEQTVKTHLNKIFQKIGVRDRIQLALYAARVGIVGLHNPLA